MAGANRSRAIDFRIKARLSPLLIGLLALPASASVVQVVPTPHGWRLQRDGQPYFVKGACARGEHMRLKELATAGANSVRLYETQDAQRALDEGMRLGLTVTVGINIDLPRHGFDLTDPVVVEVQRARVRAAVERFKDHPALLAWGLGNEVDLKQDSHDQREVVLRFLNSLAQMVKALDPNHPTVMVLAGMTRNKADQVKQWCPDVDIVGINIYGGLERLKDNLQQWGFARPYLVTEWGPTGYWEAPHTAWKAPIEASSSEKAVQLKNAYEASIIGDSNCLGSYAFGLGEQTRSDRHVVRFVPPKWRAIGRPGRTDGGVDRPTASGAVSTYRTDQPHQRPICARRDGERERSGHKFASY